MGQVSLILWLLPSHLTLPPPALETSPSQRLGFSFPFPRLSFLCNLNHLVPMGFLASWFLVPTLAFSFLFPFTPPMGGVPVQAGLFQIPWLCSPLHLQQTSQSYLGASRPHCFSGCIPDSSISKVPTTTPCLIWRIPDPVSGVHHGQNVGSVSLLIL